MTIPFYKPCIGDDEINEVVDTLKGGWLTTGPKVKQFESAFAEYVGQRHAVAVNSCTAALHLALEAIGLQAGQGVVVPTMTFAATAEVVRYFGARPILADCREVDFNLDVADAERRIEWARSQGIEAKAIMPEYYWGQVGDVDGVTALAGRFGLKVIEDAAHCCPAYYRGKGERRGQRAESRKEERGAGSGEQEGKAESREQKEESRKQKAENRKDGGLSTLNSQPSTPDWSPVGSAADITCYSFYANKTITTGEGGMACTNDDEYADRMRIMSLHGISRDAWKRYTGEGNWYYEIIAPGFKYNLTDIAAAIGIHQLRKADAFHARRSELARLYASLLGEVEEVILPQVQPDRVHSWHLYSLRLRVDRLKIDRAQFIAELKERGIGTSVHWLPLHMHPYYRETYGYRPGDFPVAASLYPQLVTLPIYPAMSEEDVRRVCAGIKQILKKQGDGR
jgi:dTDP-4-amino-4,6-dideoxygalactose transaminase